MMRRIAASCFFIPLFLVSLSMTGQAQESDRMRTADGHPDISGTFTFRTLTPMQRPQQFADLETLDQETAAQFEATERISTPKLAHRMPVISLELRAASFRIMNFGTSAGLS